MALSQQEFDALKEKLRAKKMPGTKTSTIQGDINIPGRDEKPGFFKGLAQDVARPFLRTGLTGAKAFGGLAGLATGNKELIKKSASAQPVDFGFFGDISPVGATPEGALKDLGGTIKDIAGTGLEAGASLLGGGGGVQAGKQLFKSQLGKAVKTGAKSGAKAGGLFSGGRALQEDKGVVETVAQTGIGVVGGGLTGGVLGGAGAGATVALTPIKTLTTKVGPALKNLGSKIETTVIKPVKRDMEKGFKAENIFKHELGGTLKESFDKSTAKLADLRKQANALREGQEKVIDFTNVMQDALDDLNKERLGLYGVKGKVDTAFRNFVKEFEQVSPDRKLTVPQAQEIKEAVGSIGSWLFGNRDLDANAQQKVANSIYSSLRKTIEKESKPGLDNINKQMAEIIPIKNALIRRIPVAERQSIIGIGDIVAASASLANPKGWGLFILNRMLKSPKVAEKLFKAGTKLENIKLPKALDIKKNLKK